MVIVRGPQWRKNTWKPDFSSLGLFTGADNKAAQVGGMNDKRRKLYKSKLTAKAKPVALSLLASTLILQCNLNSPSGASTRLIKLKPLHRTNQANISLLTVIIDVFTQKQDEDILGINSVAFTKTTTNIKVCLE